MSNLYADDRGFVYYVESDINVRLPFRLIGQSLEVKVKGQHIVNRLGRDKVLAPLTDLCELSRKLDVPPEI